MKNYSAVTEPKDIATKEYVDSNITTVKGQIAKNSTDIMSKVDFKQNQYLSEAEKQQARNNIGAGTSNFSGSYNSLSDKPTIPTQLSQLGSDSTHQTVTASEKTAWNNKSNFSGSYNDLTNKPSSFPPSYHTQSASSISGGTFTGTVYANSSGQNPGSYCLRNSKLSNTGEKPTVNGQITIGYDGKPSSVMVNGTVYPIGGGSGTKAKAIWSGSLQANQETRLSEDLFGYDVVYFMFVESGDSSVKTFCAVLPGMASFGQGTSFICREIGTLYGYPLGVTYVQTNNIVQNKSQIATIRGIYGIKF